MRYPWTWIHLFNLLWIIPIYAVDCVVIKSSKSYLTDYFDCAKVGQAYHVLIWTNLQLHTLPNSNHHLLVWYTSSKTEVLCSTSSFKNCCGLSRTWVVGVMNPCLFFALDFLTLTSNFLSFSNTLVKCLFTRICSFTA